MNQISLTPNIHTPSVKGIFRHLSEYKTLFSTLVVQNNYMAEIFAQNDLK